MLSKPPITELTQREPNLYALTSAIAKRAHKIARKESEIAIPGHEKPVSIAANDLHKGNVIVLENRVNKEDENDLWVVKGDFFDHALNEFVISMFANELNVLVPECKLAFYRDKLAAFIKYLPNIRLLSKKEAQEEAEVFEDYLKQFFIGAVFYNDDHLEVFIDDKKRVWQLDNAEGGLGSLKFHMRVLEMSEADKRFKEHFVNYIKGMEEKAD